jgi:tryptophanyl-tRNA synthetase
MESPKNKTIFSGIQPSGALHIGNYLGAIKQWIALQENNNAYYCIVDEHAITIPYDPTKLPDYILDTTTIYLAAGLNPNKSTVFVQSHVPSHTKLAWLLATQTSLGELSRMTQYKEKSDKHKNQASLGLLAYPVLQAADILLYQTDLVPVGEDQLQHVELTRDIAKRFNNKFGDTFTIPKSLVNKDAARIMSLSDPTKKMSKSDQPKSYIALTDSAADIRKKIASAVTETDPVISFTKSGPGAKNLLNILKAFRDDSEKNIEAEFNNLGFKELKEETADTVVEALAPLQKRFQEIRSDEDKLNHILSEGAEQAATTANETIQLVQEKMGLI